MNDNDFTDGKDGSEKNVLLAVPVAGSEKAASPGGLFSLFYQSGKQDELSSDAGMGEPALDGKIDGESHDRVSGNGSDFPDGAGNDTQLSGLLPPARELALQLLGDHKGKLAIGVAATLGVMIYYNWRERRLARTDPGEYARLQRVKAGVRAVALEPAGGAEQEPLAQTGFVSDMRSRTEAVPGPVVEMMEIDAPDSSLKAQEAPATIAVPDRSRPRRPFRP
jgi:hypothetical protein